MKGNFLHLPHHDFDLLPQVSKWEVKTSKIGGFNSLHTPALTQVLPEDI